MVSKSLNFVLQELLKLSYIELHQNVVAYKSFR